jgi:predicted aspartyl protease
VIRGTVDDRGFPLVRLVVAEREWPAVIDTAFSGDLELPYHLGTSVDAWFIGTSHSALAAGQSVVEELYRVRFPFDGESLVAEATFSQTDKILIGTRLLRRHRLEINFVERTVLLERVG